MIGKALRFIGSQLLYAVLAAVVGIAVYFIQTAALERILHRRRRFIFFGPRRDVPAYERMH